MLVEILQSILQVSHNIAGVVRRPGQVVHQTECRTERLIEHPLSEWANSLRDSQDRSQESTSGHTHCGALTVLST